MGGLCARFACFAGREAVTSDLTGASRLDGYKPSLAANHVDPAPGAWGWLSESGFTSHLLMRANLGVSRL